MAREIVDIALVEITSTSQGNKELETIVSMTIAVNDPTAMVKTMRRKRRGLGYQHGVPEFNIDIEAVLEAGTPEVDWRALQKSKEKFLLTYEENDGGKRNSLIDCVVVDVSKPFTEAGETRLSIKIMALDEKPE